MRDGRRFVKWRVIEYDCSMDLAIVGIDCATDPRKTGLALGVPKGKKTFISDIILKRSMRNMYFVLKSLLRREKIEPKYKISTYPTIKCGTINLLKTAIKI